MLVSTFRLDNTQTRTRKELREDADKIQKKIKSLKRTLFLMNREHLLLCDDEQRFTEEKEMVDEYYLPEGAKRRKVRKVEKLIGKVHWKESFKDEDDPENPIIIERCVVIRVDGEWDGV